MDLLSERELAAWRGMLRAHAALTKALDAELEHEHELALSAYEVLMQLGDAPGERLRMAELADRVVLSRSGLTRLVDRLERQGLLRREPCEDDARGFFAVLTAAGRRKVAVARPTHLAGVRRLFLRHLDPDELDRFGDVWDRLLADLTESD